MTDTKLRRFGEWLEYRREELGMTQDELAEKMGNTSSFVSELELADDAYITENEAKQLILGLDIHTEKLLQVPGFHLAVEPIVALTDEPSNQ